MSLGDILNSALTGLNASQAGLRAASSNIANVSTPGYARERVAYSTIVSGGRIMGVRAGEAERVADRFLEANVYRRSGDVGRAGLVDSYLDRLQAMLGPPGSESGLPARINAIGAAAVVMTGSAATEQTVRSFTSRVQDSLSALKQLDGDVAVLKADVATELRAGVDRVNELIGRVGYLNDAVARLTAAGRSTSGANGLRMTAVEELAGLVRITTREQTDGRLVVETAAGVTLVDRRARMLDYPAGDGADQLAYPPIAMRFVEPDGSPGAATGELLDSSNIGGKLGGLLELRDLRLPAFSEQMGSLFRGLAESLNAASNAGTTVPAPATLVGGQTGLDAADRLGFTGRAVFAVTQANGNLVASATLDFDAMPPGTTIADAVTAINAGLGAAGTASFVNGRLKLSASSPGTGIVVAQDPAAPSARGGAGFSQFFGLNDLVTAPGGTLSPSGLVPADPHRFTLGQTAELVLRDPGGRTLASQTLSPLAGGSFADLLGDLNGGSLSAFGSFALDPRGRLAFTPDPAIPSATVSIISDTTDRAGTGRSFGSLMALSGEGSGLSLAAVRPDILASAQRLPLARLNLAALPGQPALGAGDNRGATGFVDRLGQGVDLGRHGNLPIERFASIVFGRTGMDAANASEQAVDALARRDDAVARRDSFSGVNVDEELAQLVVLQNSYSAAARVLSTATQMYDTLIEMVR